MDENTRKRSDRKRTASENKELRRDNARLRKQIQKLNAAVNSLTYQGFNAEEEEPAESIEQEIKSSLPVNLKNPCPRCGQPTGEVELGRYTYLFCSSCDYRERKPGQKPV